MAEERVLELEDLDVTTEAWEDLKREVLADDPDQIAPLFLDDARECKRRVTSSCICTACSNSGSGADCLDCADCDC
jgi:hypothetical protein